MRAFSSQNGLKFGKPIFAQFLHQNILEALYILFPTEFKAETFITPQTTLKLCAPFPFAR